MIFSSLLQSSSSSDPQRCRVGDSSLLRGQNDTAINSVRLFLSRKVVDRCFFLQLSPPSERWCFVLWFGACKSWPKLLNTSDLPLVMAALSAGLSAPYLPFASADGQALWLYTRAGKYNCIHHQNRNNSVETKEEDGSGMSKTIHPTRFFPSSFTTSS